MRSRAEARFAAFLDRAGLSWHYEPRAFASPQGQYLPDFSIDWVRPLFVDVKGTLDVARVADVQARMRIVRASVPNAWLAIAVTDWDRLLLDRAAAPLGRYHAGLFGSCPTGHITFGTGR